MFSNAIANLLNDRHVIKLDDSLITHQIITAHAHINDGWNLLHTLLTKTCPFLGGQSINVAMEITLLKIEPSKTIQLFYKRFQNIDTKLCYSREHVDKTCLLKFYFKAMS